MYVCHFLLVELSKKKKEMKMKMEKKKEGAPGMGEEERGSRSFPFFSVRLFFCMSILFFSSPLLVIYLPLSSLLL